VDVGKAIRNALAVKGPVIVEVMCERDQVMVPEEE
jgi:thiamine pyrophosphate-dependent acetolactate synthase large subunit-like protein